MGTRSARSAPPRPISTCCCGTGGPRTGSTCTAFRTCSGRGGKTCGSPGADGRRGGRPDVRVEPCVERLADSKELDDAVLGTCGPEPGSRRPLLPRDDALVL